MNKDYDYFIKSLESMNISKNIEIINMIMDCFVFFGKPNKALTQLNALLEEKYSPNE